MKNFLFLIVSIFILGYSNNLFSQEKPTDTTAISQLYLITKNDGTEYIGKILSDDGREVLIETESLGKIYIPKSEIKSIVKIDDQKLIVHGEYQQEGPFTTRYAFTTNALSIKKGENYALVNLHGPEVHFALSDNFSLGVMSTWIASPLILAAKYNIRTKNEKINLSVGTLMGTSGYLNSFKGFGGLHFGNITIGSRMKNLTFSGGYLYIQTGIEDVFPDEGIIYSQDSYYYSNNDNRVMEPLIQGPIFSVAGIIKVGAKASFIFDSMIGIFTQKDYSIVTTTVVEPYYNPNPPYDYIPGNYKHEISHFDQTTTALFIMPGMRFQSSDRRAFQVSLAGVSAFRWKNSSNNGTNDSFPFPMCTWFFRF